jgi:hypothetical protein
MSNNITGFNKRTVISESLEYTLTISSYTSRERKNAASKRFFITKVYATGREEGVGFDADEFRALVAAVAS